MYTCINVGETSRYDIRHVRVGGHHMLYVCRRGTNGHKQASDKGASTAAVYARPRGRWNPVGHSERTTGSWANTEAGRTCKAVRAQSGARSRSSSTTRGRGVGCVLPSSRHRGGGVVSRGYRRGVFDPDHAGNNCASTRRSQDDRCRLSQGGSRARSNRQRSKSHPFGGTKLGVSREPIPPCWPTADAEHRQDAPQSRLAVSPRGLRCIGLQARIPRRTPANPRSVPEAERRRCGRSSTCAFVGVGQEYCFLCSSSDRRSDGCRFVAAGRIAVRFHRPLAERASGICSAEAVVTNQFVLLDRPSGRVSHVVLSERRVNPPVPPSVRYAGFVVPSSDPVCHSSL